MKRALRRMALALPLAAVSWLIWQNLDVSSVEAPDAAHDGKPQDGAVADALGRSPGRNAPERDNQGSRDHQASGAEQSDAEPLPAPPAGDSSSAPTANDPRFDLDVRPHPLGAERQRVQEQHALLDEVSASLEQGDPSRARELLRAHAGEFSLDGWEDRQRGYQLLIECMERSTDDDLEERAVRFLREERASPLRRHVRRTCLEARAFKRRT